MTFFDIQPISFHLLIVRDMIASAKTNFRSVTIISSEVTSTIRQYLLHLNSKFSFFVKRSFNVRILDSWVRNMIAALALLKQSMKFDPKQSFQDSIMIDKNYIMNCSNKIFWNDKNTYSLNNDITHTPEVCRIWIEYDLKIYLYLWKLMLPMKILDCCI